MKKLLANFSPRARLFTAIVGVIIILDQWTKYLAIKHLTRAMTPVGDIELGLWGRIGRFWSTEHPARDGIVEVIPNFWHFRYVENPGAAFGFLNQAAHWIRTPFFLIVAVAAMVFIIAYFRRTLPQQKLLRVALGLVMGGALGNFIDRARLAYVIDFIDWHFYDKFTWPTFNIADAGITIGVALLILDMLLHREEATAVAASSKAKPSKAS